MGSPGLRRAVAALLMLALTFAGVGRAYASVPDQSTGTIIVAGYVVHLCHTDDGSDPADHPASKHDCCSDCALCAPVVLPGPVTFVRPPAQIRTVEINRAAPWTPHVARPRTPRQSQGPPVA